MRFALDVIETVRGQGDCIIWPYCVSKGGYGAVTLNGKLVTVVRFIMSAIDGPDRPGWYVAHLPGECHTPRCIRPAHIRWATPSENNHDMRADGTSGRRVLTLDMALDIRSRYAAGGIYQRQLACEYGVDVATIGKIIRNERHKA